MLQKNTAPTHIDYAKMLIKLGHKHRIMLLLFITILFSLYSHWMVMREFHMPTYGNTMIHIASARHVVEHQEYPMIDYSYGGGIPNLYVPAYRILIAVAVLLTGLSFDLVSRLIVLLFAILVPLGFFILTRRLFGDTAAIFAAFLSVLPGELLIYTVRPLPQAMGLVLLPIAFHAFYTKNWKVALLMTFVITMIHQEAIAFLAGGLGVYFGFMLLHMLWRLLNSKDFNRELHSEIIKLSLSGIMLALAAYLIWQFVIIGHFNVFELAQFKNHEGNVVSMDNYFLKTGNLVASFSLLGLFLILAYLVNYILRDYTRIPQTFRVGFRTFFVFLIVAFGTYFTLHNFSLDRSASLISISFPFFLGPLAGLEILVISLISALMGVILVKMLDNSDTFSKYQGIAYLFLFALFIAGFVAVKNDAIGIRVFMDRFLVYLQIPLIIMAALGVNSIFEFFLQIKKVHLP